MSTQTGTDANLLRLYPHMFQLDAIIWDEMRRSNGWDNSLFEYDTKLGTYPVGIEETESTPRSLLDALYLKRADVLYRSGDNVVIVELKPRAGLSGIGQLLGYAALYREKYPTVQAIDMILATDRAQTDVGRMCALHGVYLYETQGSSRLLPQSLSALIATVD